MPLTATPPAAGFSAGRVRASADAVVTGASNAAQVLTPRAVRDLERAGVDTSAWHRLTGVRVIGGGMRVALPWPDVDGRPGIGRAVPGDVLAEAIATARGERATHTGNQWGGPATRTGNQSGGPANGIGNQSGSRANGIGNQSGVGATVLFRSRRSTDDHVEVWPELRAADGTRLPGHGWVVPTGDGLVTVGVGALDPATTATPDRCAAVLMRWIAALPASWELSGATMVGAPQPAAPQLPFDVPAPVARTLAALADAPWVCGVATRRVLPSGGVLRVLLDRVATTADAAVETCVTTPTMGHVTRAATHPGTERGVDQR
ncbi:hypothetical protein BCF74_110106 [Knoellia remsis]|uniref:Uncharacterized protein n=1 Tax=Knoellia remsis TaxID=407159 RepID=A0A2T0UN60_9MICO|nr:hypothetical protein [Knoellia remsis]PRY59369.1 hypothetical protein BCF74_110106 [Knoellia remsis]